MNRFLSTRMPVCAFVRVCIRASASACLRLRLRLRLPRLRLRLHFCVRQVLRSIY